MPTDLPDYAATPPPWVVFPDLDCDEAANQGAVANYIELEWLPWFQSLDAADQQGYLDHWRASASWRNAIHVRYQSTADWEADARESEKYLADFQKDEPDRQRKVWDWRKWF